MLGWSRRGFRLSRRFEHLAAVMIEFHRLFKPQNGVDELFIETKPRGTGGEQSLKFKLFIETP